MSVSTPESAKQFSKEVWKYHNEVRLNPSILIPFIEEDLNLFEGSTLNRPGKIPLCTNEGPSAWHEAIDFLRNQQPLNPISWNDSLESAANDHANDIGPNGIMGHTGSDGSSMTDRIDRHGNWESNVGENIAAGSETPQHVIKELVIDDGVSSRGHRTNIFKPEFKVIGVGAAQHTEYGSVCVLVYAGGMDSGNTISYAPAISAAGVDADDGKAPVLRSAAPQRAAVNSAPPARGPPNAEGGSSSNEEKGACCVCQ
jgi:hypothetical protein